MSGTDKLYRYAMSGTDKLYRYAMSGTDKLYRYAMSNSRTKASLDTKKGDGEGGSEKAEKEREEEQEGGEEGEAVTVRVVLQFDYQRGALSGRVVKVVEDNGALGVGGNGALEGAREGSQAVVTGAWLRGVKRGDVAKVLPCSRP
eukprot:3938074-Rhodomonas_salina.1